VDKSTHWINAAVSKPTPIPIGDGSYCCNPEDSVICAIWCETDGEAWLMCWAKQRYCEDGQWRNDDKVGFEPTHWLPIPGAPSY
jgi:hypothetical protein